MIHKENSDWLLPALLSATAGAVDVIGFLALGVFMAHITGNLVILAAHYVTGKFGEIGPILLVPIFMLVLSVVTLAFVAVPTRVPRRALLVLQAILALHGSPSTAVMTTNTAQLAVDVATLIRNRDHHADVSQARRRAHLTLASVLGFVLGLIIGAILETRFGL